MKFKIRFTLNNTRRNGILSGYRPTWCCDNKPDHNSGMIHWPGEGIGLGETRDVFLWPLSSEMWNNVAVNDILRCMEGSRVVGEATVLEILPDVPMV